MQGEKLIKKLLSASFQITACLIFFCFSAFLYQFSTSNPLPNSDLVYCPLQKEWVKSNSDEPNFRYEALDGVCAPESRKKSFFNRASFNVFARQTFFDAQKTENLFFAYARRGAQAFAEIQFPTNTPAPKIAKANSTEASLPNFQTDFACKTKISAITPQLPRPPNARKKVFFEISLVRLPDKISRRTAPRAPPVFA